jgi:hypothetical protein
MATVHEEITEYNPRLSRSVGKKDLDPEVVISDIRLWIKVKARDRPKVLALTKLMFPNELKLIPSTKNNQGDFEG